MAVVFITALTVVYFVCIYTVIYATPNKSYIGSQVKKILSPLCLYTEALLTFLLLTRLWNCPSCQEKQHTCKIWITMELVQAIFFCDVITKIIAVF